MSLRSARQGYPCGVLAVLCCVTLAATSASASEGDHELWLGASAEASPRVGLDVRYRYAWSDFIAFGAGVQHRQGLSALAAPAESALTADTRVVIDALTWVPSIAVGVGAVTAWDGSAAPLLRFAGALAYRPARDWSVQLRLGVEQSAAIGGSRAFVALSYGWIRGAASDLDF